jgi:hypothetical protein
VSAGFAAAVKGVVPEGVTLIVVPRAKGLLESQRLPPHPFTAGRRDFGALLQAKPDVFRGRPLICDTTIWSSTAGASTASSASGGTSPAETRQRMGCSRTRGVGRRRFDGITADFYRFDVGFLGRAATRIINEVRASTGWCMM